MDNHRYLKLTGCYPGHDTGSAIDANYGHHKLIFLKQRPAFSHGIMPCSNKKRGRGYTICAGNKCLHQRGKGSNQ